jgi:hypothetical protein
MEPPDDRIGPMHSEERLYAIGQYIRSNHPNHNWFGILEMDEFKKLSLKHKLEKHHIKSIRLGFQGKPPERHPDLPPVVEDFSQHIFSFGKYEGKKFTEIPPKFFEWFLKQPWVDQWPVMKDITVRFLASTKDSKTRAIDSVKEMIANLESYDSKP